MWGSWETYAYGGSELSEIQIFCFIRLLLNGFSSKLHRVLEFPLQNLCLHFWHLLYLCGFIPEGCCRQVLNLHKCFQIKTVKVLLYFPGSLMFRNKHWQCLFTAFWSISAHVSSTLSPRLVELAILSGDSKGQAWELYLKKGEIRQSAARDTCSPLMAARDSPGQSLVLDVAQHHLNPSQQTIPHMPSALSLVLFVCFPQLS